MYGEPGRRPRPGLQRAADRGDTFSHADEAVARTEVGGGVGAGRTGVCDRDRQPAGLATDTDTGCCARGMFEHVGERLLDDAVRRELYDVRQRTQ